MLEGTFIAGQNSPALHHYRSKAETADGYSGALLHFQDGPIKEFGVNGTTNEEVIEVLIARIESLNEMENGKFKCRENSLAITKLEEALMWLQRRTANREARSVEGTNVP